VKAAGAVEIHLGIEEKAKVIVQPVLVLNPLLRLLGRGFLVLCGLGVLLLCMKGLLYGVTALIIGVAGAGFLAMWCFIAFAGGKALLRMWRQHRPANGN
jgi:hypothetical protein